MCAHRRVSPPPPRDGRTDPRFALAPGGATLASAGLDGTCLALGCADTTIRLIDVASRQEVATLRVHTDYVHAVAWSPDGTRLASSSDDYAGRIWDSLSIQARGSSKPAKADPLRRSEPTALNSDPARDRNDRLLDHEDLAIVMAGLSASWTLPAGSYLGRSD